MIRNDSRIQYLNSEQEILEKFGPNVKYFQVTGRLANQLLGLSDAHGIAKQFNVRMVVDVTQVVLDEKVLPEWLSYIGSWKWLSVVASNNSEPLIKLSNLWNVNQASKSGVYEDSFGYVGFSVSIKNLQNSDLFQRGQFPFDLDFRTRIMEPRGVAVSIRGMDYINFPDLGILPIKYYKRALRELKVERSTDIAIFSDDQERSRKIMAKLGYESYSFDETESPLEALYRLSRHKNIVMANSTFSYLGCFFSSANSIISPRPFYLMDPDWNRLLHLENEKIVTSFKYQRASFLGLKIRKYLQ